MNADSKVDAAVVGHAGVALGHAVLHFDRASDRVDDAAKLDEDAVAGALEHTPVVDCDRWVDQIAAQSPKPRQSAILVGADEAAKSDNVGSHDRCKLAGFGHCDLFGVRIAQLRTQESRRLCPMANWGAFDPFGGPPERSLLEHRGRTP